MTDISGINGVSDDSTRHYTPTTEEVRNTFWLGQHSVSKTHWANSEADFNKWLAEVKADAWEEGYAAGSADSYDSRLDADNPYRQGETND